MGWLLAAAFLAGGLRYLLLEWLVEHRLAGSGRARFWMVYAAVATDLFGDGLMIGTGTSVSFGLAVTLALGQVLADVPEGFAVIFTLRADEVPRRRRLLLSASFALPALLGALLAPGCADAGRSCSTPPWWRQPDCSPWRRWRT